jgi:YVTN family beta-propeller protein
VRTIYGAIVSLCVAACGGESGTDAGQDSGPQIDGGAACASEDFPEPVEGTCTATIATGAELPAGDDGAGGFIVPSGERLTRVGRNLPLGGFPMRAISIPGTRFIVVSDGGLREETLRVVNVDTLEVAFEETFPPVATEAMFLGLAISGDGTRLWVSGGGTNEVIAYDVDTASGALARDNAASFSIALETTDGYVSGLALSEDGVLAIASMLGDEIVLYDTDAGAELRRAALEEGATPYDVVFSPDGSDLWVSLWADRQLVRIDVATGAVETSIDVGKNPQGLAISPDGARLAVACSDSDSIAIVDIATGLLDETIWVIGEEAPRGVSPAALRFGSDGRLYVANSLENAVDVFEPSGLTYTRVGAIPTMWHPTDVMALDDGTVVFLNGRHTGTGPNVDPRMMDITSLMGGSLSVVDPVELDDPQLAAWEIEIDANNTRTARLADVECPGENDFPIPQPGQGPSAQIEHVILIVRENKTYDAYLGDLEDASGAPYGNGDPSLTLMGPDVIEDVIPNTRALALTFGLADNYYSHAEQSVQGHFWTTHGRTTDFVERSWLTTWGRGFWRIPPQGTTDVGYPEEGSAFDWLVDNEISAHNFGEIVGSRSLPPFRNYPGFVYSYIPDTDKARWMDEHIRRDCGLRSFTYVVMPNDHTQGLDPGERTPESMIADNDQAIGIVADSISHSTYWPRTVIFVIEDDPQDGGDHVDNHRSPLIVISPWARRGVSSVHYSESSIWRTIQLIFGVQAPLNRAWEMAAPLYDMFTSTPDYTPYVHTPRRWPEEVNPDNGSRMAIISESYDWRLPDDQPGLSRLLWEHFHGGRAPWPDRPDAYGEEEEEEED